MSIVSVDFQEINRMMTADDILSRERKETKFVVTGVLPIGLTLLAGKPKNGKSWLALQMALAKSAGGRMFGKSVDAGGALYLALEDSPTRLQDRMSKMSWPRGLPCEFITMLDYQKEIGPLNKGGNLKLAKLIEERGYKLVIIDTFSRSCYLKKNEEDLVVPALVPLQEMAHKHECAVVLIHHHNKGFGRGRDVIDDVLGSTGIAGVADTILGLYRDDKNVTLLGRGRDLEDVELTITFDATTSCWQLSEKKLAVPLQRIVDYLSGRDSANLADIALGTSQDKGNTSRWLNQLVTMNMVCREGDHYSLSM
jgi:RecA-family ATPase